MENRAYLGSITKYEILGFGSHADVYFADYFDSSVAYKEFWNPKYVAAIKDEVTKLGKLDGEGKFIFPDVFIYEKFTDEIFKGYTMPLLYNYNILYEDFLSQLDYDKKVEILLKARDLLEELHTKYRIIHADVAPWNLLYNDDKNKVVLTDFDTSLSITNNITINESHNDLVKEYNKYHKIDEHLDIYLFNLCCFSILNNLDLYHVIDEIRKNNFGVIERNKAIEIYSSYKDISDVKSLKKEYIIDYLK